MPKWEIRVTQINVLDKPEKANYLVIEVVAPGEQHKPGIALCSEATDQEVERVAREVVDNALQLNAAEVTPVVALEARFWAAVEGLKHPDVDLAEAVTRGIRQDAELLRKAEREVRIDECRRFLSLRDSLPGSTLLSEMYDSVRRRIAELEAEGEE